MERSIGRAKLECTERVHATLDHQRFVRIRCTERDCPDVVYAREHGLIAIHVWDVRTRQQWTDFEPDPKRRRRGKGETHHG